MNPIDRSAARGKTLHRRFNQRINLAGVKGGVGGIQFEVGCF
jgi:hypothetical protein